VDKQTTLNSQNHEEPGHDININKYLRKFTERFFSQKKKKKEIMMT